LFDKIAYQGEGKVPVGLTVPVHMGSPFWVAYLEICALLIALLVTWFKDI